VQTWLWCKEWKPAGTAAVSTPTRPSAKWWGWLPSFRRLSMRCGFRWSPPEALPTVEGWQRRLRWVRVQHKWAQASCGRRKPGSIPHGPRRSQRLRRKTRFQRARGSKSGDRLCARRHLQRCTATRALSGASRSHRRDEDCRNQGGRCASYAGVGRTVCRPRARGTGPNDPTTPLGRCGRDPPLLSLGAPRRCEGVDRVNHWYCSSPSVASS
jgi:hypothetical protein